MATKPKAGARRLVICNVCGNLFTSVWPIGAPTEPRETLVLARCPVCALTADRPGGVLGNGYDVSEVWEPASIFDALRYFFGGRRR